VKDMKETDKKETIKTLPKGIWEASPATNDAQPASSCKTDLQKNGYPTNQNKDNE